MNIELLIVHGDKQYTPVVQEGITWSTDRKGSPGQLTFKVVKDAIIDFAEGDAVKLMVDGVGVFFGFVFKKKRDKDHIIEVTAYDQLRYLKNKDTYVYEGKTASEVVKMLADDFYLQSGTLEDTKYKIASRVEDNTSLFDMIQNALDLTLQNRKEMFVLFDDFGKLTLKSLDNMKVNILIDEETCENFDYTTSIDGDTYNKVKLIFENEDTGRREVYIAQDSDRMNRWGVLQYFDTLDKGENGQFKTNALLSLYKEKIRNLSIKNALGDVRVRAGTLIPVILNLGDIKIQQYMLVEKCKHEFKANQHSMTLNLKGGDFIA